MQDLSPMMKQYFDIKNQYFNYLVLFRLGDFYEFFEEDASVVSQILGLALTHRQTYRMCGFPASSKEGYVKQLLAHNKKLVVCEQIEVPGQKMLERKVMEVLTPGVYLDKKEDEHWETSYLMSILWDENHMAVSCCDLRESRVLVHFHSRDKEFLQSLISKYNPSEILCYDIPSEFDFVFNTLPVTRVAEYYFSPSINEVMILDHFKVVSLKGIGLENPLMLSVVGAILKYFKDNLFQDIMHIDRVYCVKDEDIVYLSEGAINSLELVKATSYKNKAANLISQINLTFTPMGARFLKYSILNPLTSISEINNRLDKVEFLIEHTMILNMLGDHFRNLGDVQKLLAKLALEKATPKELVSLKRSFEFILKALVLTKETILEDHFEEDVLQEFVDKIEHCLVEETNNDFGSETGVLQNSYSPLLEQLRKKAFNSYQILEDLLQKEQNVYPHLKIKVQSNKIWGFYFEVTKTNLKGNPPSHFISLGSTKLTERFSTPELTDLEKEILRSTTELKKEEQELYLEFLKSLKPFVRSLYQATYWVEYVDMLSSFARLADRSNYTRPNLHLDHEINIIDGRHPVIENYTPQFVPNSLFFGEKDQYIQIITGPNMAGKSTILRQTALIILLAHIGCFVPATSASIALTDKIFTRIGSSDNLSEGESTFLVEMLETAQILNQSTSRSFIIMDEVGRGTSTYDGLAIATGIIDFFSQEDFPRGKLLFATHYHELGELEGPLIKQLKMKIIEHLGELMFLYEIEEGMSSKSYGIQVAEIAGVPRSIINKAKEVMEQLELSHIKKTKSTILNVSSKQSTQDLSKISQSVKYDIWNLIKDQDINRMSPMDALLFLKDIQMKLFEK